MSKGNGMLDLNSSIEKCYNESINETIDGIIGEE